MSVAAASGAVSTHQHQPTPEQIRLAQLIHDNKHDQPEVQEIVRKVLDVVANSNPEEALLALFDCDYDYERTVALLIEKGNEISSEWRTATNHKTTKKQQQKNAANKNGHGGETDENVQQRGNDGSTNRGKSRGGGGGRSRIQQQNGGDSQANTQQQNDNYTSQQRYRGGSGYRGRHRGNNRGNYRGNDRNFQQYQSEQQPQDSHVDTSAPSDTTQRSTNVSYKNRRDGRGRGGSSSAKHQPSDSSNWNGELSTVSKSTTNDEQSTTCDNPNASHVRSGTVNGPNSSSGVSTLNNIPNVNTQQKSKGEFDAVEVTRQIKSAIGIGQSQQQNSIPPQPLMDIKPIIADQQKSHIMSSKSAVQMPTTKVTPLPRIPHQPVIFSDRFDGGINKIDVQFGNLGESAEESSSQNVSIPASSSSASVFYSHSEPVVSTTKPKNVLSSVPNSQRSTATTVPHPSAEQSAFVSPPTHTTTIRVTDQPVVNQQRMIPPQMQQQQQPSMTMKPVVPPQYAVHHQQHQMNPPNLLIQSLLYHPSQQEPVPLDTSYDPTAFPLPSIDFNTSYFMATAMNQQPPQQQTQQRYLVSQAPPPQQQQQISSNRQQSSANVQTPPLSTSSSVPVSSATTAVSTAPKKGPAVPPGMFLSTAPPTPPAAYSTAYSTTYGIPPTIGGQQQTGAATYSAPYDTEHLFQNPFLQLNNPQQTQSPTGTYGSVTPPVQQQNQTLNNNDNKPMSYRGPINENLLLLQQFQQFNIQQSNSQQQGPQATHSPAQLNYFLGHSAGTPNYSPGPAIMYAQPTTAIAQQQASKQQAHQYNQTNSSTNIGGNDDYYGRNNSSSSSNKEAHYMYAVSTQPQQVPPQSVGQHQGVNKQQQAQQQQRNSGNVYNNQQGQQRPF